MPNLGSDSPKQAVETKAEMADNGQAERPTDWEKVKESERLIRVFCEHTAQRSQAKQGQAVDK